MAFDDLKHAQRERLIHLDRCLTWRGMANRKDLMRRFDISTAQAALDFRVYLDRARETPPIYDPVRKTYIAAINHKSLAPSCLTEAFDILLNEDEAGLSSILPQPVRKAEPKVIAVLHQAMRAGEALFITYTSMTSGADDGQWIAPTHFTSDGESVHLRAYSFKHGDYRIYLPIRIEPNSSFERQSLVEPLPEDRDWQTRAIIWLRPKSDLSPEQANVAMREFGFDGPMLRVETRKALEFFFDRRWGLNERGARLERAKTEYSTIEET